MCVWKKRKISTLGLYKSVQGKTGKRFIINKRMKILIFFRSNMNSNQEYFQQNVIYLVKCSAKHISSSLDENFLLVLHPLVMFNITI